MKFYTVHMILQDKLYDRSYCKAYGISTERSPSYERALQTIRIHINSKDHMCCMAYIAEHDEDNNKKIVFAKTFVDIVGEYYYESKQFAKEDESV